MEFKRIGEIMANYRKDRVDEQLRQELSEIFRDIKDPRVTTAFLSVMRVDCTPDLKFAKVYVSVMKERRDGDAIKGLTNAEGYIRTRLARSMNLRITPELKFLRDDSARNGQRINDLLKQVEDELKEPEIGEAEDE